MNATNVVYSEADSPDDWTPKGGIFPATNLPPIAAIDSAMLELQRGLVMLRNAQDSAQDADMYAATLRSVEVTVCAALEHMRQHQKGAPT
jgi:hypothetical protein